MQIEWKWCDKFSRVNFKHKFYTTPVTFRRRHHSPPYSIFYAFMWGLHSNVTFPRDSQIGVSKLRVLISHNFGRSYLLQIFFFLEMKEKYFIAP
jgi:hypothetical protein